MVDANTGKTLDEKNPDSLRHPASLTKIMTLYLLFERLDAGKMKLSNMMSVSEHASEQAPTKLGLRPGQTLNVEDAIRGLVTRSANDAAVVIAEAIGGDEESFAKMMTAKARALGMSHTTYRNASGLPDDDQVTTARDQALLGRAIQERFPRYYRYFSTTSFTWRGEEIRNHNHLLGRVKASTASRPATRAPRASILSLGAPRQPSHRGGGAGRQLGRLARRQDARPDRGSHRRGLDPPHRHHGGRSAERAAPPTPAPSRSLRPAQAAATPAPAPAPASAGFALSSAASVPVPPPTAAQAAQGPTIKHRAAATGSTDPIKPIVLKTVKVKIAPPNTASLAPAASMILVEETAAPAPAPAPVAAPAAVAPAPVAAAPAPAPAPVAAPKAAPAQPDVRSAQPALALQAEPVKPAALAVVAAAAASEPAAAPARSTPVRSGWIVQVGAFATESEAKQHLDEAQSKAKKLLGHADPFTEPVTKGDKTFYRARFAGLERDQAEATCKQLRRSDIACMTIKN